MQTPQELCLLLQAAVSGLQGTLFCGYEIGLILHQVPVWTTAQERTKVIGLLHGRKLCDQRSAQLVVILWVVLGQQ
jgi:hypothetical protein